METTIELGYAGVVIGRVTVAGEIDENSLFLPVPDPLPVGTRVSLKIDGRTTAARVIGVTETAEAGKAGMRVRVTDTGASVEAAPAPAQAPVTAPVLAEAAAPVAPASVTPSQASDTHAPVVEIVPETSEAQGEAGGDGAPSSEDLGGNSGPNPAGSGGGRRRRRRR